MAHNKVYGFCESGCKVEVDPAGKVKPVSEGGTGATDAEQARKNIGAASETHKHSADDIGGGTIPIANGGTGGSTAREAEYNICKGVAETTNAIADDTLIISKRTDASATNGAFTTKRASLLWSYIVGKIRSTFGFSASNVLPIANGGTGATSAANARAALGITPANIGAATSGHTHTAEAIGAVKKSGDTMTGSLSATRFGICALNDYPTFGLMRNSDTEEHAFMQTGTNGAFGFYSYNADMDGKSARYREGFSLPGANSGLTANKTYAILTSKNPVTVAQGGTGATTAAGACESIGAVKKSGDTMTGTLYSRNAYAMCIGTDAVPNWNTVAYSNDGTNNRMMFHQRGQNGKFEYFNLPPTSSPAANAHYDILTSKTPVTVAQGGTGATTAAAALKNLGLEIQTGTVNDVNSTGVTVTFPTAFSGVPVVVATGSSEQSSVQIKNVTKTGFKIESPMPNNDGCQWIAIYKA